MAKGLRPMLLLSALAWMVAGTEAQDTSDDFKWTHVIYPAPNSHDRDFCNRIMKKRGLDDRRTNTLVVMTDDQMMMICRSPQGQELTMKYWSSFAKLPIIMCRSKDEGDSDSTYSNYSTVRTNDAILVECRNGMVVKLHGIGDGGLGQ